MHRRTLPAYRHRPDGQEQAGRRQSEKPAALLQALPPAQPGGGPAALRDLQQRPAVPAPGRAEGGAELQPPLQSGEKQPDDARHRRRCQKVQQQPVEEVDPKGLGEKQVFQKIVPEIIIPQGLAPPIAADLRRDPLPGHQGAKNQKPMLPAQDFPAPDALRRRRAESPAAQDHAQGHEQQEQISDVLDGVNSQHPRNAQGGLPHLSEDKFGDHHQGHHGVHISDPHQRQQKDIVQGTGRQGPAPHNPKVPQGASHYLRQGEVLTLPVKSDGVDDDTVLVKNQQRRTQKQKQEQQPALQVQKCQQHVLIEADACGGNVGLVYLAEKGIDQT